jgi:hypothetical protein
VGAVAVGFLVGLYLSLGLLFALSSWGGFEPGLELLQKAVVHAERLPHPFNVAFAKAVCAHYAPTFATARPPASRRRDCSPERRAAACLLVVAYAGHALLGQCRKKAWIET